ncbi:MAG: carboxypeptidase regulatory-like domain-containing protein [Planctomycetota bacterium]
MVALFLLAGGAQRGLRRVVGPAVPPSAAGQVPFVEPGNERAEAFPVPSVRAYTPAGQVGAQADAEVSPRGLSRLATRIWAAAEVAVGIRPTPGAAGEKGQNQQLVEAEPEPEPGALEGVVLDEDREPVAKARVRVLSGRKRFHDLRTDERGRFRIDPVKPGRYSVSARASAFVDGRLSVVDLHPGEDKYTLEIVLKRGGEIRGRVRSNGGDPIAGARVSVARRGAFGAATAKTNKKGYYRLRGATFGRNRVSVSHPDYRAPKSKVVKVVKPAEGAEAKPGRADFVMAEGGVVQGLVVGRFGPVNARIDVLDAKNRRVRRIRAAEEGSFRIGGLTPGQKYKLRAGPEEGAVAILGVRAPKRGTEDVTLFLEHGGRIEGQVLGPQGSPLAGVLVRADRYSTPFRVQKRTDGAGRFALPGLPDGSFRVRVLPDGALREPAAVRVDVIAATGPDDLIFKVNGGAELEGRVIAEDGGPAGGAVVSVWNQQGRRIGQATAGPDGRYRISRLVEGPMHVFSRLGNELIRTSTQLWTGETTQLELPLHLMGQIKGVVLNEAGEPVQSARVECVSLDGIVKRAANTNARGQYVVRHLYPGSYRVFTSKPKKSVTEAVVPIVPRLVHDGVQLAVN